MMTLLYCNFFRRFVYVWDTVTRKILYKLPGHTGSVNDVDVHPSEPICKQINNDFISVILVSLNFTRVKLEISICIHLKLYPLPNKLCMGREYNFPLKNKNLEKLLGLFKY